MAKASFSEPGCQKYRGEEHGATVEFVEFGWTVRKPEVSTPSECMAGPGCPTPALSGRTVMGPRWVKKLAKHFFSELGCQKYWGDSLAPRWSFSNQCGPL